MAKWRLQDTCSRYVDTEAIYVIVIAVRTHLFSDHNKLFVFMSP